MARERRASEYLEQFYDPSDKFSQVEDRTRASKQQAFFGNMIDNIVKKIEAMYAAYQEEMESKGPVQQLLGTVLPMVLGAPGSMLAGLGSMYSNEQVRQKYEDKLAAIKEQYEGTFLEDYAEGAYEGIKESEDDLRSSSLMGLASSLMVPKMIDWGFGGVGEALKEGPFKGDVITQNILDAGETPPSFTGPLADPDLAFQAIPAMPDEKLLGPLTESYLGEATWNPFTVGDASKELVSKGRDPVMQWVDEVADYAEGKQSANLTTIPNYIEDLMTRPEVLASSEEIIPGSPDIYEASTKPVNLAGINPELLSQLKNIEGPSFIPFSEQQVPIDMVGDLAKKIPGFGNLNNLSPMRNALLWGGRMAAPYLAQNFMGGKGYGYVPQFGRAPRPINPALMRRYS